MNGRKEKTPTAGEPEGLRKMGRPRSERSKRAILEETVRFLEREDQGLEKLSIEHLAAEAGVSKATVYRWWPSRTALVVEAFAEQTAFKLQYADSGSLVDDISQQMQRLARIMSSSRGRMLTQILAAGQSDAVLLHAFQEGFIKPRRQETAVVLARGVKRGELPKGTDFESVIDMLYGPMYFRLMLWKTPPRAEWVDALCRNVLRGVQCKDRKTAKIVKASSKNN